MYTVFARSDAALRTGGPSVWPDRRTGGPSVLGWKDWGFVYPLTPELQSNLTDAKYLKVQSHLWELFGREEYNRIAELAGQLCTSPSSEWTNVGMWFKLMNCVFIHECKDHQKCAAVLLKPALKKCRHPTITNQSVLEGRIFLCMSQVLLTRGVTLNNTGL